MSLSVKTQGGVGGMTASIFVTGLSESDTVTASYGDKTKVAVWNSTESRHEITGIGDKGMWTVTATNGDETKTQDVLVDGAFEYEIEMYFKLWLYREGDECEDVTGGWVGKVFASDFNGLGSFAKGDTSLQMTSAANKSAGFFTANKIDLTLYSTLVVNVLAATGARSDFTINHTAQILTSRNVNGARYKTDVGSPSVGECRWSMAEFQGGYYIGVGCWENGELEVDKVWLE
jgi:hypothetical protein